MKSIILIAAALVGFQVQAHKVNNGVIQQNADITCMQETDPREFRDSLLHLYLYETSQKTYQAVLVKKSMHSTNEVLSNQELIVRTDIMPVLPALFLVSANGKVHFNMNLGFPGKNDGKRAHYTDVALNLKVDFICN